MEIQKLSANRSREVAEALAGCPLFESLKADHFPQLLKVSEVVRYESGETVVQEGEPSDAFFVILDGVASIGMKNAAGESTELGTLEPMASFGEVGLLLDEPRTATVHAVGELEVLRLGAKAYVKMFERLPQFGQAISKRLASRLKSTSNKVPLPAYDVHKGMPDAQVLALLPHELCQRHRVLPLELRGNSLTLGTVDDPSSALLAAVRGWAPAMELQVTRIENPYFNEVMHARAGLSERSSATAQPSESSEPPEPLPLDRLLERMVAEGASDLHLSAGHRAYWRIDGDMREIADSPVLGPSDVLELFRTRVEKRHVDTFEATGDADFAYSAPNVARFRVNLLKGREGSGAVMRLISSKVQSLDQLGMPAVIANLCDTPKGLILVTGPTGSGKSTTLAAMIDHIKRTTQGHIVTLEDPIEFVHESESCLVTQREVGGHTKSFARGLRAALREDPDVVLVGEMRDSETIALALEAANTGHLVLATLHTNSAISAIDRIVEQFTADQQPQIRSRLADALRGVVAQTLVKKTGGGRIAALEVLVVNYAVSNLIRESKTVQIPSIMQANKAIGMSLLNSELARLVETRKIDLEEALSAAVNKGDLRKRFRSGVFLASDPASDERFRVIDVKPGSPGATAGLQRGMYVVEIDRKPARDYSLDEARGVFRVDGAHDLRVEWGGKKSKLNLDLGTASAASEPAKPAKRRTTRTGPSAPTV